jgi:hypothetical protein
VWACVRVLHSGRPVGVSLLARQAAGPYGVASGSGGEAPDPGSPPGEGNKRARASTSTSPGDTGRPPRPLITARHASRTAVLSSPELLEHVFSFLAGGKDKAREDLGRAALVCQGWRDAAVGEGLWVRVASEAMPEMGRRVSEVGGRRCMLDHGHCIRDQRAWVGWTYLYKLRLQVEVWDMLDETCLMAVEGRMGRTDHPHELSPTGADRVEVVGPAFSAASRDPVQRRFASIDDYFRRGPEGTVQEGIVVRVYVRDVMRGRQALLWDVCYGAGELRCLIVPPDHSLRPLLPEGSRMVRQTEALPIYSPALPGQALQASMGFFVRPEAGQEGVAERTRCGGWRGATSTTTATTPRASTLSSMLT